MKAYHVFAACLGLFACQALMAGEVNWNIVYTADYSQYANYTVALVYNGFDAAWDDYPVPVVSRDANGKTTLDTPALVYGIAQFNAGEFAQGTAGHLKLNVWSWQEIEYNGNPGAIEVWHPERWIEVTDRAPTTEAPSQPSLNSVNEGLFFMIAFNAKDIKNATDWIVISNPLVDEDKENPIITVTFTFTPPWEPVPEPATMALLAVGGVLLALRRRV